MMRPETALLVRKIIEQHFNTICAAFKVPADQETYYNQWLDHLREIWPDRDWEFYFNIFIEFWENVIGPANSLEPSERWGTPPHGDLENLVKVRSDHKGAALEAKEIGSPHRPPETEAQHPLETLAVLDQIAALGNCLMAVSEDKELQSRKQTYVSLGIFIHQVVKIVNDLLNPDKI